MKFKLTQYSTLQPEVKDVAIGESKRVAIVEIKTIFYENHNYILTSSTHIISAYVFPTPQINKHRL